MENWLFPQYFTKYFWDFWLRSESIDLWKITPDFYNNLSHFGGNVAASPLTPLGHFNITWKIKNTNWFILSWLHIKGKYFLISNCSKFNKALHFSGCEACPANLTPIIHLRIEWKTYSNRWLICAFTGKFYLLIPGDRKLAAVSNQKCSRTLVRQHLSDNTFSPTFLRQHLFA